MQHHSNFTIYSASAGSGKTFTLVKEYLKILLKTKNTSKFKQILAVTFTNKAAAEMKNRVIDALHSFSKQESNDMLSIISEELNLEEAEIYKRSQKILEAILQNYSAFNIVTIDSFTLNLIKTFALDLKLPLNFDVELDAESLLNEAVDVVISKIGEDKELTSLLVNYAVQKLDNDKSWDISLDLKEFSKILLNENNAVYLDEFKQIPILKLVSIKKELQKKNKEIEGKFNEIGKKGLSIIENEGLDFKEFYRSLIPNHFLNLANSATKAKFFDQSVLKLRIEEQTFYAKSKPDYIKNAIDSIINELIDLYLQSEQLFQEKTLNELIIEGIIPLAVLSSINISLQEIKSDNNILLNAEFNKIISDTIKNEPAPFIYERLGEKFRYYFIDEMQDTSVLQWQNFIPLIGNALASENEFGEKGNLLLVGDAKQSIYRWRGGKPEQFMHLSSKEKFEKNNPFFVDKSTFNLETNYRSYSEIIEFNNNFFNHLAGFLSNNVNSELYLNGNNQLTTQKEGGFVQLSFVEKNDNIEIKEQIPTKVFEIINNLETSFKKSEICVLVRTKKQGIEIADYLVSENIEIISSETLLLNNSKKVQFIINLLYTVINPESNVYKIKLLYFLFEHLQISSKKHEFISQLLNLDLDSFFKELEKFDIDFSLTKFNETPFYERFEYIVRAFNLTTESDANIQFFLDVVFEYQQKKANTIYEFVEYWEFKKDKISIVAPENENAIRIMTIHKAKGLEFPVVIYPYDLDIYREQKHKVWYKYENESGVNNMLLSYGSKLKYSGEQGKQLYEQHREELEFDNFNLLYVTFTRAVEQLYVITEKKISIKNEENLNFSSGILINFLKNIGLWQTDKLKYEFGGIERIGVKSLPNEKTITHTNYISNSWNSNNISIVSNSSVLWGTEKGKSIAYGNLIHEMLSKIRTKNDIKETVNEYIFCGTIKKREGDEIEKVLQNVVNHPNLKAFFSQNNTILNEKEIVSIDKRISIPDRLIINKNEVIILDYKTGKFEEKHYNQLEGYSNLLNELGYKVLKKILVYINEEIIIKEF